MELVSWLVEEKGFDVQEWNQVFYSIQMVLCIYVCMVLCDGAKFSIPPLCIMLDNSYALQSLSRQDASQKCLWKMLATIL